MFQGEREHVWAIFWEFKELVGRELSLLYIVMSIRRKVAQDRSQLLHWELLFAFVMCHSSHRSYPRTCGLVIFSLRLFFCLILPQDNAEILWKQWSDDKMITYFSLSTITFLKSEPPKGDTLLNYVVIVIVSALYVFDVVVSHFYSKKHLIDNFKLHTGKLSHSITKHLNFVLI